MVAPVQLSPRQRLLVDWLERRLGWRVASLEPASADASFRRYYRLTVPADGLAALAAAASGGDGGGKLPEAPASVILMDAPPPAEDLGRFVACAERLARLELNVPRVLVAEEALGAALVTDLGSTTYLDALEGGAPPAPLYAAAVDALVRLQAGPARAAAAAPAEPPLPAYDRALLVRELDVFEEWYLGRHHGLRLDPPRRRALDAARAALVDAALAQAQVTVHRDYHSRNLMLTPPLPGILDFQDMVTGPVSYDLVSLLRDCYVDLPAALEDAMIRRYFRGAAAAGVPVPAPEALRADLDWMGVQRHLKVLGIFVRLWYRDGRPDYLQYLPRVRRYVTAACARWPALRSVGELVASLAAADAAAVATIVRDGGARTGARS